MNCYKIYWNRRTGAFVARSQYETMKEPEGWTIEAEYVSEYALRGFIKFSQYVDEYLKYKI